MHIVFRLDLSFVKLYIIFFAFFTIFFFAQLYSQAHYYWDCGPDFPSSLQIDFSNLWFPFSTTVSGFFFKKTMSLAVFDQTELTKIPNQIGLNLVQSFEVCSRNRCVYILGIVSHACTCRTNPADIPYYLRITYQAMEKLSTIQTWQNLTSKYRV